MHIPVGVIKEWRKREQDRRRLEKEERDRMPAHYPEDKQPHAEKPKRKPPTKVVINLS